MGGDYDGLFLTTKPQALSFIYRSIGCLQSLRPRPGAEAYEPPCVPCLLPTGFIRWQTIQLLMDPDEHWGYLVRAMELWDICDAHGNPFPKDLPRDAFAAEPDVEMIKWHEHVSARLEQDYRNQQAQSNPSSPPHFTGYHYRFTGKDPLPDEEEYFSAPGHGQRYRPQSRHEPEPPRQRQHRRESSDEYPDLSRHRHRPQSQSAYYHRENGGRSGMASPRCPSPAPRMDHHHRRTRGRERASMHAHPSNYETDETDLEPESGYTTREDERDPPHRRRRSHRHHNLSPPDEVRARRHSHDAYTRKPVRDLSPHTPRRPCGYEPEPVPIPRTRKYNSDGTPLYRPREGRSRSRPSGGISWKEYIFGTHHHDPPAPAPEPPMYTRMPHTPRRRHHLDPYANEDLRRGSYGGTPGSRPGSGSGPERPRAYSTAGYPGSGGSRYPSPQRGCAPKRYPGHGPEMPYMPRRQPPAPHAHPHAYD